VVGPGRRSTTDSLCAQPCATPRTFHWFSNDDGTERVYQEVVDAAWADGRTPHAAAGIIGDVLAKSRRAASGMLRSASDLVPVRLHPMLWELRWRLGRVGEFRMYHAEPGADPDLVALRFHHKDTSGSTQGEIDSVQEGEMDVAQARYERRSTDRWGHTRGCTGCLHP